MESKICTVQHGPEHVIMQLCKYIEKNRPKCLQIIICEKWNYGSYRFSSLCLCTFKHCTDTSKIIPSFFFFLVLPVYCYQPISLHPRAHMLSHVIPWTSARQTPLSMGFFQARILEWVAISFSRVFFS